MSSPQGGNDTSLLASASATSGKVQELVIPPELGKIDEINFEPRTTGYAPRNLARGPWSVDRQFVVLIQDAHSIPDAQRSLEKLIEYLQGHYGVSTIALEGAEGKLDPTLFRMFPDAEKRAAVFADFLGAGELSGAAIASVLSPHKAEYVGIEDWNLYQEGVALFLAGLEKQAELSVQCSVLSSQLQEMKTKYYSAEALEFDAKVSAWQADSSKMTGFLEYLSKFSESNVQSTMLNALFKTLAQEKVRNLRLEAEVKELARYAHEKAPSAKLNGLVQDYRTGRISLAALAYEVSKMVPFQPRSLKSVPRSHELQTLIANHEALVGMKGAAFVEELDFFIQETKQGLFVTPEAQAVEALDVRIRLLEKLLKFELSRGEWNQIRAMGQEPRATMKDFEMLNIRVHELLGRATDFTLFYELAERREVVFMKNINEIQAERGSWSVSRGTVVVTGGFHTDGLAAKLKEQGISYVVISPAIKEIPKDNRYVAQMQGDVSWRSYFKPRSGKIDLYDAFARSTVDRLMSRGTGNGERGTNPGLKAQDSDLKSWRDDIIRTLAVEGRVADHAKYTRYIDQRAAEQSTEFQALKSTWSAKLEKFIEGLQFLQGKNQLTEANVAKLLGQPANQTPYAVNMVPGMSVPVNWVTEKHEGVGIRASQERVVEASSEQGVPPLAGATTFKRSETRGGQTVDSEVGERPAKSGVATKVVLAVAAGGLLLGGAFLLDHFLKIFLTIFFVVNPIGSAVTFVSMTGEMDASARKILSRKSLIAATTVGALFLFAGNLLFDFMGITLGTFMIAGGALLFTISLTSLTSTAIEKKINPEDMGVVPLGIPLIVGPATLTTLMILRGQYSWPVVITAFLANMFLTAVLFRYSEKVIVALGKEGAKVIGKIFNLLLAALGVTLIVKGLLTVFPGLHSDTVRPLNLSPEKPAIEVIEKQVRSEVREVIVGLAVVGGIAAAIVAAAWQGFVIYKKRKAESGAAMRAFLTDVLKVMSKADDVSAPMDTSEEGFRKLRVSFRQPIWWDVRYPLTSFAKNQKVNGALVSEKGLPKGSPEALARIFAEADEGLMQQHQAMKGWTAPERFAVYAAFIAGQDWPSVLRDISARKSRARRISVEKVARVASGRLAERYARAMEDLGLDPDMTGYADTKKQFHKKAMRWHPDRNPNDASAAANFRKINEAWEKLQEEEAQTVLKQRERGVAGPAHVLPPAQEALLKRKLAQEVSAILKEGRFRLSTDSFEDPSFWQMVFSMEPVYAIASAHLFMDARIRAYDELKVDEGTDRIDLKPLLTRTLLILKGESYKRSKPKRKMLEAQAPEAARSEMPLSPNAPRPSRDSVDARSEMPLSPNAPRTSQDSLDARSEMRLRTILLGAGETPWAPKGFQSLGQWKSFALALTVAAVTSGVFLLFHFFAPGFLPFRVSLFTTAVIGIFISGIIDKDLRLKRFLWSLPGLILANITVPWYIPMIKTLSGMPYGYPLAAYLDIYGFALPIFLTSFITMGFYRTKPDVDERLKSYAKRVAFTGIRSFFKDSGFLQILTLSGLPIALFNYSSFVGGFGAIQPILIVNQIIFSVIAPYFAFKKPSNGSGKIHLTETLLGRSYYLNLAVVFGWALDSVFAGNKAHSLFAFGIMAGSFLPLVPIYLAGLFIKRDKPSAPARGQSVKAFPATEAVYGPFRTWLYDRLVLPEGLRNRFPGSDFILTPGFAHNGAVEIVAGEAWGEKVSAKLVAMGVDPAKMEHVFSGDASVHRHFRSIMENSMPVTADAQGKVSFDRSQAELVFKRMVDLKLWKKIPSKFYLVSRAGKKDSFELWPQELWDILSSILWPGLPKRSGDLFEEFWSDFETLESLRRITMALSGGAVHYPIAHSEHSLSWRGWIDHEIALADQQVIVSVSAGVLRKILSEEGPAVSEEETRMLLSHFNNAVDSVVSYIPASFIASPEHLDQVMAKHPEWNVSVRKSTKPEPVEKSVLGNWFAQKLLIDSPDAFRNTVILREAERRFRELLPVFHADAQKIIDEVERKILNQKKSQTSTLPVGFSRSEMPLSPNASRTSQDSLDARSEKPLLSNEPRTSRDSLDARSEMRGGAGLGEAHLDMQPRAKSVDLGNGKRQVFLSVMPTKGTSAEEQVQSVIRALDRLLAEQKITRDYIFKQVISFGDITDEDRDKIKKTLRNYYTSGIAPPAGKPNSTYARLSLISNGKSVLSKSAVKELINDLDAVERVPVTTFIEQTPLDGSLFTMEVSAVKGSTVLRISEQVTAVEDDAMIQVYTGGVTPDTSSPDGYDQSMSMLKQTRDALAKAETGLKRLGRIPENSTLDYRQVLRTWFYQNDILKDDPTGGHRYQKLNNARYDYFTASLGGKAVPFGEGMIEDASQENPVWPASTGIGMLRGTMAMESLAFIPKKDDVGAIRLTSPRQMNPFQYTPDVLIGGKKPPLWSRAMSIFTSGYEMITVSGTASTKGQNVMFVGDPLKQTLYTLSSIELVLKKRGASLKDVPQLRVYIKNPEHYAIIKSAIDQRFPGLPVIYTHADVCRTDWLVEMEAFAFVTTTYRERARIAMLVNEPDWNEPDLLKRAMDAWTYLTDKMKQVRYLERVWRKVVSVKNGKRFDASLGDLFWEHGRHTISSHTMNVFSALDYLSVTPGLSLEERQRVRDDVWKNFEAIQENQATVQSTLRTVLDLDFKKHASVLVKYKGTHADPVPYGDLTPYLLNLAFNSDWRLPGNNYKKFRQAVLDVYDAWPKVEAAVDAFLKSPLAEVSEGVSVKRSEIRVSHAMVLQGMYRRSFQIEAGDVADLKTKLGLLKDPGVGNAGTFPENVVDLSDPVAVKNAAIEFLGKDGEGKFAEISVAQEAGKTVLDIKWKINRTIAGGQDAADQLIELLNGIGLDAADSRKILDLKMLPDSQASPGIAALLSLVNRPEELTRRLPDVQKRNILLKGLLRSPAYAKQIAPESIGIKPEWITSLPERARATVASLIDYANKEKPFISAWIQERKEFDPEEKGADLPAWRTALNIFLDEIPFTMTTINRERLAKLIRKRFSGYDPEASDHWEKVLTVLTEIVPDRLDIQTIGITDADEKALEKVFGRLSTVAGLDDILDNSEKFIEKTDPTLREKILRPLIYMVPNLVPVRDLGLTQDTVRRLAALKIPGIAEHGVRDTAQLIEFWNSTGILSIRPLTKDSSGGLVSQSLQSAPFYRQLSREDRLEIGYVLIQFADLESLTYKSLDSLSDEQKLMLEARHCPNLNAALGRSEMREVSREFTVGPTGLHLLPLTTLRKFWEMVLAPLGMEVLFLDEAKSKKVPVAETLGILALELIPGTQKKFFVKGPYHKEILEEVADVIIEVHDSVPSDFKPYRDRISAILKTRIVAARKGVFQKLAAIFSGFWSGIVEGMSEETLPQDKMPQLMDVLKMTLGYGNMQGAASALYHFLALDPVYGPVAKNFTMSEDGVFEASMGTAENLLIRVEILKAGFWGTTVTISTEGKDGVSPTLRYRSLPHAQAKLEALGAQGLWKKAEPSLDMEKVLYQNSSPRAAPTKEDTAESMMGLAHEFETKIHQEFDLLWAQGWTEEKLLRAVSLLMPEVDPDSAEALVMMAALSKEWTPVRLVREMAENSWNAYASNEEEGLIHVRVGRGKQSVLLEVSDDGPGVSHVKDAHGRFTLVPQHFHEGAVSRAGFKSHGLGIETARAVTEAHGGKMEILSPGVEGHKTTVRFTFPEHTFLAIHRSELRGDGRPVLQSVLGNGILAEDWPEMRRKFHVLNAYEIHLRPSKILADMASEIAGKTGIHVFIRKEDSELKIMSSANQLLSLGIRYDQEVELLAKGARPLPMLEGVLDFFEKAMPDWKMLENGITENPLFEDYLAEIDRLTSRMFLRSTWSAEPLGAMETRKVRDRMTVLSSAFSALLKGSRAEANARMLETMLLQDQQAHDLLPEAERLMRSFLAIYRLPREGDALEVGVAVSMFHEQNRLRPVSPDNPNGEDALAWKIRELDELFSVNPNVRYVLFLADDGELPSDQIDPASALTFTLLPSRVSQSAFWKGYQGFMNLHVQPFLMAVLKRLQKAQLEGKVAQPQIKDTKSSGQVALEILKARYPSKLKSGQVQVLFLGAEQKANIRGKKGSGILLLLRKLLDTGSEVRRHFLYTDLDRAVPGGEFGLLVEKLASGEADVAIGSRWLKASKVYGRLKEEKRGSFLYNLITRGVLGLPYSDTQEGLKGFTREALESIFPIDTKGNLDPDFSYGFDFDTHLLLRLRKLKAKVLEIPNIWIGSPEESTVDPKSKVNAVLSILTQQFPERWRTSVVRSESREGKQRDALPGGAMEGTEEDYVHKASTPEYFDYFRMIRSSLSTVNYGAEEALKVLGDFQRKQGNVERRRIKKYGEIKRFARGDERIFAPVQVIVGHLEDLQIQRSLWFVARFFLLLKDAGLFSWILSVLLRERVAHPEAANLFQLIREAGLKSKHPAYAISRAILEAWEEDVRVNPSHPMDPYDRFALKAYPVEKAAKEDGKIYVGGIKKSHHPENARVWKQNRERTKIAELDQEMEEALKRSEVRSLKDPLKEEKIEWLDERILEITAILDQLQKMDGFLGTARVVALKKKEGGDLLAMKESLQVVMISFSLFQQFRKIHDLENLLKGWNSAQKEFEAYLKRKQNRGSIARINKVQSLLKNVGDYIRQTRVAYENVHGPIRLTDEIARTIYTADDLADYAAELITQINRSPGAEGGVTLYSIMKDPAKYEKKFFLSLYELFFLKLLTDFDGASPFVEAARNILLSKGIRGLREAMDQPSGDLLSLFRGIRHDGHEEVASIDFYGQLLFFLTENLEMYFVHLYDELISTRLPLAIGRAGVSYHTRAGATILIRDKKILYGNANSRENYKRKREVPVGSVKLGDEENPDGQHLAKIRKAIEFWKELAEQLNSKTLRDRIAHFEDSAVVVEFDGVLPLIVADAERNAVRFEHTERQTGAFNFPSAFLERLNIEDPVDKAILMMALDRGQEWRELDPDSGNTLKTEAPDLAGDERIESQRRALNSDYFKTEYSHLIPMAQVKARLAALMREHVLVRYKDFMRAVIDREEAAAKFLHEGRARKHTDPFATGSQKISLETRFVFRDAISHYQYLLNRYEAMGMRRRAISIFHKIVYAIACVQLYDPEGALPIKSHQEIIFTALRLKQWPVAVNELEILLQGKVDPEGGVPESLLHGTLRRGFPKKLPADQLENIQNFLTMYSFQNKLKLEIAAQLQASLPEERADVEGYAEKMLALLDVFSNDPFGNLRLPDGRWNPELVDQGIFGGRSEVRQKDGGGGKEASGSRDGRHIILSSFALGMFTLGIVLAYPFIERFSNRFPKQYFTLERLQEPLLGMAFILFVILAHLVDNRLRTEKLAREMELGQKPLPLNLRKFFEKIAKEHQVTLEVNDVRLSKYDPPAWKVIFRDTQQRYSRMRIELQAYGSMGFRASFWKRGKGVDAILYPEGNPDNFPYVLEPHPGQFLAALKARIGKIEAIDWLGPDSFEYPAALTVAPVQESLKMEPIGLSHLGSENKKKPYAPWASTKDPWGHSLRSEMRLSGFQGPAQEAKSFGNSEWKKPPFGTFLEQGRASYDILKAKKDEKKPKGPKKPWFLYKIKDDHIEDMIPYENWWDAMRASMHALEGELGARDRQATAARIADRLEHGRIADFLAIAHVRNAQLRERILFLRKELHEKKYVDFKKHVLGFRGLAWLRSEPELAMLLEPAKEVNWLAQKNAAGNEGAIDQKLEEISSRIAVPEGFLLLLKAYFEEYYRRRLQAPTLSHSVVRGQAFEGVLESQAKASEAMKLLLFQFVYFSREKDAVAFEWLSKVILSTFLKKDPKQMTLSLQEPQRIPFDVENLAPIPILNVLIRVLDLKADPWGEVPAVIPEGISRSEFYFGRGVGLSGKSGKELLEARLRRLASHDILWPQNGNAEKIYGQIERIVNGGHDFQMRLDPVTKELIGVEVMPGTEHVAWKQRNLRSEIREQGVPYDQTVLPTNELEMKMRPLALEVARIIQQQTRGGGMIVYLDGPSAAGKTSISRMLGWALKEIGYLTDSRDVDVVSLDFFLHDPATRAALEKRVAESGTPYLTEGEDFYRNAEAQAYFEAALRFIVSDGPRETRAFPISRAYLRGEKELQPKSDIVLNRGTKAQREVTLVDGKFALDMKKAMDARGLKCPAITLRIVGDPAKLEGRFLARTRAKVSGDADFLEKRTAFYRLGMVPSYDAYAARTRADVDVFLHMESDHEKDWRLELRPGLLSSLESGSIQEPSLKGGRPESEERSTAVRSEIRNFGYSANDQFNTPADFVKGLEEKERRTKTALGGIRGGRDIRIDLYIVPPSQGSDVAHSLGVSGRAQMAAEALRTYLPKAKIRLVGDDALLSIWESEGVFSKDHFDGFLKGGSVGGWPVDPRTDLALVFSFDPLNKKVTDQLKAQGIPFLECPPFSYAFGRGGVNPEGKPTVDLKVPFGSLLLASGLRGRKAAKDGWSEDRLVAARDVWLKRNLSASQRSLLQEKAKTEGWDLNRAAWTWAYQKDWDLFETEMFSVKRWLSSSIRDPQLFDEKGKRLVVFIVGEIPADVLARIQPKNGEALTFVPVGTIPSGEMRTLASELNGAFRKTRKDGQEFWIDFPAYVTGSGSWLDAVSSRSIFRHDNNDAGMGKEDQLASLLLKHLAVETPGQDWKTLNEAARVASNDMDMKRSTRRYEGLAAWTADARDFSDQMFRHFDWAKDVVRFLGEGLRQVTESEARTDYGTIARETREIAAYYKQHETLTPAQFESLKKYAASMGISFTSGDLEGYLAASSLGVVLTHVGLIALAAEFLSDPRESPVLTTGAAAVWSWISDNHINHELSHFPTALNDYLSIFDFYLPPESRNLELENRLEVWRERYLLRLTMGLYYQGTDSKVLVRTAQEMEEAVAEGVVLLGEGVKYLESLEVKDNADFNEMFQNLRAKIESLNAIVFMMEHFRQSGTGKNARARVDVNEMSRHAAFMILDAYVRNAGYKVRLDLDQAVSGAEFSADLWFLWSNLLTNALDALNQRDAHDKKYQPTIGIRTRYDADKREIVLEFSDNGNGIKKEDLGKIWQKGFTTKGKNGTGLGLSFVKEIVEKNHGIVAVKSVESQGTTFTIRLPTLSTYAVEMGSFERVLTAVVGRGKLSQEDLPRFTALARSELRTVIRGLREAFDLFVVTQAIAAMRVLAPDEAEAYQALERVLVDGNLSREELTQTAGRLFDGQLELLAESIRKGEMRGMAPVIFYSPEIKAQLLKFIETVQQSFDALGDETGKQYQITVVFEKRNELQDFQRDFSKQGPVQGVKILGDKGVERINEELKTAVTDHLVFGSKFGVFFPTPVLAKGIKTWQRVVYPEVPKEYAMILLPALTRYFALFKTESLTEETLATTLRQALPDLFASARFQVKQGIVIVAESLQYLVNAARQIAASA